MCVKPIKIYNNSHVIKEFISQPLRMFVPCGKCYECQQLKSSEYYARSYFEALATFKKGGYVLYDTLTYSDDFVPTSKAVLSDLIDTSNLANFMVFDRTDFTNFMKRLRKRLHSDGYDYRNIKYLVCGEYGTSERGTHRPHLHLLFFVQNSAIIPEYLSRCINSCWCKGRTDGIDYRGSVYFNSNSVIRSSNSNLLTTIYITKYIEKDSSYQKTLNYRLKYVRKVLLNQRDRGYENTYEYRLEFNKIKRAINQFQLNSQHFGESIIDNYSIDDLIKNDYIVCPSSQSAVKRLPIPRYIKRKVFYNFDKSAKRYIINNDGINYFISRNDINRQRYVDRLRNVINDIALNPCYYQFETKPLLRLSDSVLSKLYDYDRFYNNRIDGIQFYSSDFILKNQFFCDDSTHLCALNTMRDSYSNNGRFIFTSDGDMFKTSEFVDKYCFHNSYFDLLLQLFSKSSEVVKVKRQEAYERVQSLRKQYKSICKSN